MGKTFRGDPDARKARFRDLAKRTDKRVRLFNRKRDRELSRAVSRLASLQGQPNAPRARV